MWQSIVEKSLNGVFIVNGDGECIYCNPAFTYITGYSRREAPTLERCVEKLFPDPKYRRCAMNAFAKEADPKSGAATLLQTVCRNGSVKEIEFYPFFLKDGDLGVILKNVNHYADRLKKIEALRKKLNDQLEENFLTLNLTHRQLANARHELMEASTAMIVLAKRMEESRKETEKKIAMFIRSRVMPILKNIQRQENNKISAKSTKELEILAAYLNSLTLCLNEGTNIFVSLSNTEMRICAMIQNGLSSRQIADQLHVSLETVKTHRRNIRKKLKIHNSNTNLTTFLRSKKH